MKKNNHQWIVVGILSIAIAIFNSLRIIIGASQTPPGYTFLAIGHYYQDYFVYTQQIAQGIFGHPFAGNQFTTNDPTQTLIGTGLYLLIGRLAAVFRLSPFSAYWIAVFLFSVVLCVVLFYTIRRLLSHQPFYLQISSFLFCLFAVPFIKIVFEGANRTIIPFNYWYAPITIFNRIGGIPHHILISIFTVLILNLSADLIFCVSNSKWKLMGIRITMLLLLLILLLTFGPLQVINCLSGIMIVCLFIMGKLYFFDKKPTRSMYLGIGLAVILIFILPTAFIIQSMHGKEDLFKRVIAWDVAQQYYPSIWEMLLTTGPILLFVPFGIRRYFFPMTPIKLLVLFFTLSSYFFTFTPLAKHLGTFNLRFLSSVSYVFFGTLAIVGLQTIVQKLKYKKLVTSLCIVGFLVYCLIVNISYSRSFAGPEELGYIPTSVLTGIQTLNSYPDQDAVFTSPAFYLGMLVPCIVDRNVYLGRMFFTPNYEEKIGISDRFYQGKMTPEEAKQLLLENSIGYVLLSILEPYPLSNLQKYPFLKEIYKNNTLSIFRFLEQ